MNDHHTKRLPTVRKEAALAAGANYNWRPEVKQTPNGRRIVKMCEY